MSHAYRKLAYLAVLAAALGLAAPAAARRCPASVVRISHVSGTLDRGGRLVRHGATWSGTIHVVAGGRAKTYRLHRARGRFAAAQLPAGAPVRLTVRTVSRSVGCSHRRRSTTTVRALVVGAPPSPSPLRPPTSSPPPPPQPPPATPLLSRVLKGIGDVVCGTVGCD